MEWAKRAAWLKIESGLNEFVHSVGSCSMQCNVRPELSKDFPDCDVTYLRRKIGMLNKLYIHVLGNLNLNQPVSLHV
jgi:hypothetical protein